MVTLRAATIHHAHFACVFHFQRGILFCIPSPNHIIPPSIVELRGAQRPEGSTSIVSVSTCPLFHMEVDIYVYNISGTGIDSLTRLSPYASRSGLLAAWRTFFPVRGSLRGARSSGR